MLFLLVLTSDSVTGVSLAVEMMQAEMELMESIKLNERNVATVNARIKHFKVRQGVRGFKYCETISL